MSVASPEVLLPQLRYVDRTRTLADVNTLIRQINSLQCKIGQHVSNTGVTETLLLLFGTVPIYYKGVQYNIPVHVWLPELYPQRPPTCYVTPTREMRIKARHKHVDQLGMIYLPYLNQWSASTSTLAELITFMSSVFSEDPPVFKYNPDAVQPAPQPVVVQPSHAPIHMHHPNASPSPSPSHLQPSPPAQSQPRSPSSQSRTISNPSAAHTPIFQPISASTSSSSLSSSSLSTSSSPSSSTTSSIISSSSQSSQSQPQSQSQDPRARRKDQLIADVTTQLQTMLLTFNTDRTATIDQLFDTQSKLSAGTEKLAAQTAAMQQHHQRLVALNEQLVTKTAHLQQWLQTYEQKQLTLADIDKAVYCKDTWSKQLLDCVSEDMAIEDTLYVLDRALLNQHIELETFLRQVRSLARKQFTARATAQKIQTKLIQQPQSSQVPTTTSVSVSQTQPSPSLNNNIQPQFHIYQPPAHSSASIPPAIPPRSPNLPPYNHMPIPGHAHNHSNPGLSPFART